MNHSSSSSQPPFSTVAAPTAASENPTPPQFDASGHLTSFTLFPKLTTELRVKIWQFAVPDPQVIETAYEIPPIELEYPGLAGTVLPNSESTKPFPSEDTHAVSTTNGDKSSIPTPDTMQYRQIIHSFRGPFGALLTSGSSSLDPLDANRGIFASTNGNRRSSDAGAPQRHIGTWRITNGLPCISILQACQESRAETKDIIGSYMMLCLDSGNTERSRFNPATDSIMITFQTENGEINTVLRPGFPLSHSIKHLMDRRMLQHMNERLWAEDNTGPAITLPDSFECSLRFSTHKLTDLEEWDKVYFHYFQHNGVKTFGMSVYRHLIDLLGADFLESEAGKHITSPCIEVGKSIRLSSEDIESKLFVSEMTFAWTGHASIFQAHAGNR
jgi:hypothetical protein